MAPGTPGCPPGVQPHVAILPETGTPVRCKNGLSWSMQPPLGIIGAPRERGSLSALTALLAAALPLLGGNEGPRYTFPEKVLSGPLAVKLPAPIGALLWETGRSCVPSPKRPRMSWRPTGCACQFPTCRQVRPQCP